MRRRIALAALAAIALLSAAPLPPPAYRLVPVPAITVTLFHQVTDHPTVSAAGIDNIQKPWIGVQQFDDVLTQWERDGYTFISPDDAEAFFTGRLPGAKLPPKPLAITFDDGWQSAWLEATPILRKHHAKAAMYFEGILTGVKPGRLTIAELRAMRESGVWTLESHGWRGHSNIVTDAHGTTDPYWYANRMWLPDRGRLETYDEFEARLTDDLTHFKRAFESVLGVTFTSFAFPSGEYGQNGPYAPPPAPLTDRYVHEVHSDDANLTPHVFNALKRAGYVWAYAVSLPGGDHDAQAMDGPWTYPRFGVGADFTDANVTQTYTQGLQLPAVTSDRQYADCGPVTFRGDEIWTASTNRPEIYRLDRDGRMLARYVIPALMNGRGAGKSAISGLLWDGDDLVLTQNTDETVKATLTRLALRADGTATIISTEPLGNGIGYLMGAVRYAGGIVGLGDDGTFFDLPGGRVHFAINLSDAQRAGRFRGPFVVDGSLAAYDTRANAVEIVRPDNTIAIRPIPTLTEPGSVENIASDGNDVLLNVWSRLRHALLRFTPLPSS